MRGFSPRALLHEFDALRGGVRSAASSQVEQAAAIATSRNEDKIRGRVATLRRWTGDLAAGLRTLGAGTFPTETYFFLADFAPHDAGAVAHRLKEHGILVKPLNDKRLGLGFMRITTSLPRTMRAFYRR